MLFKGIHHKYANRINCLMQSARYEKERRLGMTSLEMQRIEALKYVNAIRAEFFAPPLSELPKGNMRDANGCVVSMSFRDIGMASVSSRSLTLISKRREVVYDNPPAVAAFIQDFDEKRYKDLVLT